MAEIVKASVSVEYATDKDKKTEDLGPPAIVLERDDIKAPYGYAYARMYFVGKTPTTSATSGYAVHTVNRNVVSQEKGFITFQGKDESEFPTPVVSNVTIKPMGRFMGVNGETISSVNFVVDAARGTVKANKPFYGTLQVEYSSTFYRLMVQFLQIPGAKEDPTYESEFAPLVLMAYQNIGIDVEPESLALSPPNKSEDPEAKDKPKGWAAEDKSTGEKIVLEIDSTFPIGLTAAPLPGMGGLVAAARVAVYSPHAGVTFSASGGIVKGDAYSLDDVLPIQESIALVGAQSVSTKYPPVNGVTATAATPLTSKHTGGVLQLVTAPHDVALADWFSYGAYRITGSRQVTPNEIVVVSAGVAVAANGVVLASYNTRRTYVDVFWSRTGNWFQPVVLTASDAWGNTESIAISPPERRGR